MKNIEFDRWWDDLISRFPSYHKWQSEAKFAGELMLSWRQALAKVAIDDAMEINRGMQFGKLESPAAYERERMPEFILRHAGRRQSESVDAAPPGRQEFTDRRATNFPAGEIFDLVAQSEKDGWTTEQIRARLAEKYPGTNTTLQGRSAYRCLSCSDTGRMEVFHPKAVAAAKASKAIPWYVCLTACDCSAGDSWAGEGDNAVRRPMRRVDGLDTIIDPQLSDEENRQKLKEKVAS